MQGMVAGKRGRGKPRQRWEKAITHVWYGGSSKQSSRGQASILQRHLGSDVLKRICSKKNTADAITFIHVCQQLSKARRI